MGRVTPLFLLAVSVASAEPPRDAVFNQSLAFCNKVKGGFIEAHWMEDGNSFWYLDGAGAFRYDPIHAARSPLFDASRLAKALSASSGSDIFFRTASLLPGEKALRLAVDEHDYLVDLATYTIVEESDAERHRRTPRIVDKPVIDGPPPTYEILSPDGQWFLGIKDHNLYVRSTKSDETRALTVDGFKDFAWNLDNATWAPDSHSLIATLLDQRSSPKYPVVHWLTSPAEVEWVSSFAFGAQGQRWVIDFASPKRVRLPDAIQVRTWLADGSEVVATKLGARKLELLALNPTSGAARTLFTETTKTFFDMSVSLAHSPSFTPLTASRQFLWLSERDGWNQIYLYNLDGALTRKLTTDKRPVERVVAVDEKNGLVYYTAYGTERRPYDMHLYRVKLNGGTAVRLTETPGRHDQPTYVRLVRATGGATWGATGGATGEGIQFSPSRQFFLDSYSSVDHSPQTDLRRADGTFVATISKAEVGDTSSIRRFPPEEFVAKAADGTTELYGVLYKPRDFDPHRSYPVLDAIYAGPQVTRAARTYLDGIVAQAFANLGIIVFEVDARGTPSRGKAFQDVVYRNMGRNEIPDHVAVLKQLAAGRTYLDMKRVGIWGGSFGGYFAIRGMLLAPDVFQVGVATAPVADLGESLNRIWMGPPEENPEGYAYASNLRIANQLQGHLLLIHGTSDTNAKLAETIRMIDALTRDNKPYDLVLIPEGTHAAQGSWYTLQAIKRYLVEHLKP